MFGKLILLCTTLWVGLSFSACLHTDGLLQTVPSIHAAAFASSPLAQDASEVVRTPDGNPVSLICPANGLVIVEVKIKGGEKLFQVLSLGGAFKGYMHDKWDELCVIRKLEKPISVPTYGGGLPTTYDRIVILINAHELLEKQTESENIAVLPGDVIIVPGENLNLEEILQTQYKLRLNPVGSKDITLLSIPAAKATGPLSDT